ncbi:hypothetical protein EON76_05300 [bacterium]|nr:MAG: hypothetical protein EON76_05300 [bacterium]
MSASLQVAEVKKDFSDLTGVASAAQGAKADDAKRAMAGVYKLTQAASAGTGSSSADTAAIVSAINDDTVTSIVIPNIGAIWRFDPAAVNVALAARLIRKGGGQVYDLSILGEGYPEIRASTTADYLFDLRGGFAFVSGLTISDNDNYLAAAINVYKDNGFYPLAVTDMVYANIDEGVRIEAANKVLVQNQRGINVPYLLHRVNNTNRCVDSTFQNIKGDNCKILWEGYKNEGIIWDDIAVLAFDGDAMIVRQSLSCTIINCVLDGQYFNSETANAGGKGLYLGGYADDANRGLTIKNTWLGAGKNARAHIYADPASPNRAISIDGIVFGAMTEAAGTIGARINMQNVTDLDIGFIDQVGAAPTNDILTGSTPKFGKQWPWTVVALTLGVSLFPETGTITSASGTCSYRQSGDIVDFELTATITNKGTGAGLFIVKLPGPAPKTGGLPLFGRVSNFNVCVGDLNTDGFVVIAYYNGATIIDNGISISMRGSYRVDA